MFRAMELGGQVIAPLALILALAEVAAKSTAVRFCARLYIPALAIVAVVVLALDQLAQATFTKAWPDPAVFYGTPPNYVLEFAVGPVTAIVVAVIAVGDRRTPVRPARLECAAPGPADGRQPPPCCWPIRRWPSSSPTKPRSTCPSAHRCSRWLCTAAAALTWLAGARIGQLRPALAGARGQSRPAPSSRPGPTTARPDRSDFRRFEPATDGGVYRGGGLYRPDPPGRTGASGYERDHDEAGLGWQDDRPGGD